MLTINHTASPVHPSIAEFVGNLIQYVNARPYQRQPMHAIGLVIGWQQYRGLLMLKVQNTTTCRERWINAEYDFRGFVQPEVSAPEIELEDDPEYSQYLHDLAKAEHEQELEEEYQHPRFLWNGRVFPESID